MKTSLVGKIKLGSDEEKDDINLLKDSSRTDLFQLTPASELKVLTEANELTFLGHALKSKEYKRLLQLITESALEGRYETFFRFYPDEDIRYLKVFLTTLENAGYAIQLEADRATLHIKWSQ